MTLRCFIALPLPASYQQGLEQLTAKLRQGLRSRITWTRTGNWHLTLKFLGQTPESGLDALKVALSSVAFEPFLLQAGQAGFFPNDKKPRVIWTGLIQGADQSRELAARIEDAVEPLGFAREQRPFRAHLTLGRVKDGARDDWRKVLETARAAEWPPVEIREFVLYRSELTPQGPRYTRVASFGA